VAEVEAKIAAHDAARPAAAVDARARARSTGVEPQDRLVRNGDRCASEESIVRTIIHEVVADVDDAALEIVLIVRWVGGVQSKIRLPKRRRGQRSRTSTDVITAVRQLVLITNDAGIPNRYGQRTGNGNRWVRERMTWMRSNYRTSASR
jgi:hypothetical protein